MEMEENTLCIFHPLVFQSFCANISGYELTRLDLHFQATQRQDFKAAVLAVSVPAELGHRLVFWRTSWTKGVVFTGSEDKQLDMGSLSPFFPNKGLRSPPKEWMDAAHEDFL